MSKKGKKPDKYVKKKQKQKQKTKQNKGKTADNICHVSSSNRNIIIYS